MSAGTCESLWRGSTENSGVSEMPSTESNICRTCGEHATPLWSANILNFNVQYFECSNCGYVQTEQPYWLDCAYAEAINTSDTGIMLRNIVNARIVLTTLLSLGIPRGRVVDCAGGYGILVRLLRDYGVDAWWSDRYSQNLVARGFEFTGQTASLVTAFEAFEHFVDPSKELDNLLAIAPNVLLSTELIPTPTPLHGSWWYYGKEHGQHIGFFRAGTLEMMAKRRGKWFSTDGINCHLISDKPVTALLWRMLKRSNRLMPTVMKAWLSPKTWNDHLLMSGQKCANQDVNRV